MMFDGRGYRREHQQRVSDRHHAIEALGQSPSVHKLANDVRNAFFLAVSEHREDVVVAKLGDCDRFDLEANPVVLVLREELRQDLDRYVAGKGLLIGLVYRSHSSTAYLLDDQIRT
jgi:hypothetical protein